MSSTILEIKVVSCSDIYEICNSRGPDASRAQTPGRLCVYIALYVVLDCWCLLIYIVCAVVVA